MSKRHRRSKLDVLSDEDILANSADWGMPQLQKGKRPKGKRNKRETHKRAYYDD